MKTCQMNIWKTGKKIKEKDLKNFTIEKNINMDFFIPDEIQIKIINKCFDNINI